MKYAAKVTALANIIGAAAVFFTFASGIPLMERHVPWWGGMPGGAIAAVIAFVVGGLYSCALVPVVLYTRRKLHVVFALLLVLVGTAAPLAMFLFGWSFMAIGAIPYGVACAVAFTYFMFFRDRSANIVPTES